MARFGAEWQNWTRRAAAHFIPNQRRPGRAATQPDSHIQRSLPFAPPPSAAGRAALYRVTLLGTPAARTRRSRALAASAVAHLALLLALLGAPQFSRRAQPRVLLPETARLPRLPVFLVLPKDLQRPPEKVRANKLSDKNRVAQTRRPGITGAVDEVMIKQAAVAVEHPMLPLSRPVPVAPVRNVAVGDFEVLSDTQGVDFGPFLSHMVMVVQHNFDGMAPEAALPPLRKKGRVVLRFVVLPDGKITGMAVESTSGDASLDRGAWGALTASSPLPGLPHEFHGSYLAIRAGFFYNYSTGELQRDF